MGLSDLHIHTNHSYDGTASVPAVLSRARQLGLDVIAITDHDEINGSLLALKLAPKYGIEVIPGIEITTNEGDILAYNILQKVEPGLPLIETVLQVRALGGFCIAAHPMSGGFGMRSLSAYSIMKAIRNPDVARTLIGIETYNATTIDRISNHYAHILCEQLDIARLGNSDAHVTEAIGLGMTEFEGYSAKDLIQAIYAGRTSIQKRTEWNAVHILGSWAANYVANKFTRLVSTA